MPWPTQPDTEIFDMIDREVDRQNTGLQLIASENFTSPAVMDAVGSVLTNKYSEGYPTKRYYGGNQVVDQIEDLARQRVCELFGAEAANVQPHSGANANLGVYLALLEAGDTVLGLSLDHGGHLTHGSPVNISGRFYDFVSYGLTPSDERLDLVHVDAVLGHVHQVHVAAVHHQRRAGRSVHAPRDRRGEEIKADEKRDRRHQPVLDLLGIGELDHQRQIQGQIDQTGGMNPPRRTKPGDATKYRDAPNFLVVMQTRQQLSHPPFAFGAVDPHQGHR